MKVLIPQNRGDFKESAGLYFFIYHRLFISPVFPSPVTDTSKFLRYLFDITYLSLLDQASFVLKQPIVQNSKFLTKQDQFS